MSHQHSHHHQSSKNLKIAFFLNLGFTIFEFIGGLYVNSIAIVSDAVHDLGDSLSLGTSWYLQHKSKQEANDRFTYGYKRFSLLGALINCLVLLLGSVYVLYEGIKRIIEPELSDAKGMIVFAIIGVIVNGYGAWKVSKGKSMNEKIVSLHLLEDVLGWLAVLVVAIILYFYENPYLDPALSILITLYILFNVFKRLKETLFIFLQGVPKEVNLRTIKNKILNVNNVVSLHHTHVWSQEGENHIFTTHLVLKNIDQLGQLLEVKREVKEILKEYNFDHYTIETEVGGEILTLSKYK